MRTLAKTPLSLAGAIALLLAPAVARAELVVNGSFELPNATTPFGSGGFITTAPPGVIPGWTVTSSPGTVDVVQPASNWLPAYDGIQVLDLNGTPGLGSIQQTIATNPSSPLFTFSFVYTRNPGSGGGSDATYDIVDSTLTSLIGGPFTLVSTGNVITQGWQSVTHTFTTTDTSATIKFASTSPPPGNINAGIVLDAVSVQVQAVPEASTWAFLGGLGSVAACSCYLKKRRVETTA
jgi:hypothetical protein